MMIVEYNGVKIQNVLTREWRQEVVYDPSGADHLLNRHTITFEGIITEFPNKTPGVASKYAAHNLAYSGWQIVRIALSQPRHTLLVKQIYWGEHAGQPFQQEYEFFRCPPETLNPSDLNRDVSNGPKPQDVRLVSVLGSRALKISWTIQCEKLDLAYTYANEAEAKHLGEDAPGGGVLMPNSPLHETILNNRWSLREEFDENAFCVRTVSGSLRLSRGVYRCMDDGRRLVTPPLEPGFKRERMLYTIDADGLTVHYEITDRQTHTAAPWPASKMRVRHRRSTADGVRFTAACQVRLEGPPFAPKSALLARAVQIMDFYTQFLANAKNYGQSYYITQADLTEEVGEENAVEGHIELAVLGDPKNPQSTSMDFLEQQWLQLGKDLDLSKEPTPQTPVSGPRGYNPHVSWTPNQYGYTTAGQRGPQQLALWWLVQCYLQRPHRPPHTIGENPGDQPEALQAPDKVWWSPVEERLQQVDWLPRREQAAASQYSDEHKEKLYTFARMRNRLWFRKMRVGCPKAKRDVSPGDQANSQPTVAVVQLAQETVGRVLYYDAERVGDWPELPKPVDQQTGAAGCKAYLQSYEIHPFPPTTGPTGRELIYRVRAVYRYLLDRPPDEKHTWYVGHLPHVRQDTKGFDPGKFQEKLGPFA